MIIRVAMFDKQLCTCGSTNKKSIGGSTNKKSTGVMDGRQE